MIINPGSSTEKQQDAGVGRSMAGQTVEPVQGATVTAGVGAEVFNDYRARTFAADGLPAAGNVASNTYAHAEGVRTTASGDSSHAEGISTIASGTASHAEGGFKNGKPGSRATAYAAHAEGISTEASGPYSHAEGEETIALNRSDHAEGICSVAADWGYAHAEGGACIAANSSQVLKVSSYSAAAKTFTFDQTFGTFTDAFSHIAVGSRLFVVNAYYVGSANIFTVSAISSANGRVTVSETIPTSKFTPTMVVNLSYAPTTGCCDHAEGDRTVAMGNYGSHAEGQTTIASGRYSHAEGRSTTASGISSHAEGNGTTASGSEAHAEGSGTTASGNRSHAEGSGTTASGDESHAEGSGTTASGPSAHAEGSSTTASGPSAHAEGSSTTASGPSAHAEGRDTIASGWFSHAEGRATRASAMCQHAGGEYNVEYTSDTTKFIIGKGTSESARANCFRVTDTGVYATGAHNTSGADYAELFEWLDGNPESADRCGRFVTLDGEKIRLAGPEDDFILGIVSGNPSVVGDVHDDQWQGMYLYDIFGRPLWEDVEVPDVTVAEPDPEDPEKTVTRVIIPAHMEHRQRLNPAYDGSQPYQPRTQRPEWDAVGMLGKLVAVDDGTCQAGGWCTVGEGGAATHSAAHTRYRVMARLDETHVRVLIL